MKCAKCLLIKCVKNLLNILKNGSFWIGAMILIVIALIFPFLTIRLITPIDNPPQKLNGICTFLSNVKENSDWIGFWGNYFGGVSGGIITVMVFFWTIKDSEKTRKEEHRLQIMPVLDYKIVDMSCVLGKLTDEAKEWNRNQHYIEQGDYSFWLDIKLRVQNIGLGPAQKITIKKCEYGKVTTDISQSYIGTIPKECAKDIKKHISIIDNYDKEIGWRTTLTWTFCFTDIFGHTYRQKLVTKIWYCFQSEENDENKWSYEILDQEPAELEK